MSHETRHSLPPFQAVTSKDGVLSVHWAPLAQGERAAVIIALRGIAPELATDFWSGALDNDLIRQPVDAKQTQATLYVPAGRPLLLTLIVRRDDRKEPEGRALTIEACEPVAPPHTLENPVAHEAEGGPHTPLVFAHNAKPPGFEQLARQLAAQAGSGEAGLVTKAEIGAFGATQRWTLTRLTWPDQGDVPLALVVRGHFVDGKTVTAWSDSLPGDAIHIEAHCDGFIDALCPIDDLRFYILLRGPAPWLPVTLSPVPPPFDTVSHPHIIGDLGVRLAEGIETLAHRLESEELALSDVQPLLGLLEGAVALLPPQHELRVRVERIQARWEAGSRL